LSALTSVRLPDSRQAGRGLKGAGVAARRGTIGTLVHLTDA